MVPSLPFFDWKLPAVLTGVAAELGPLVDGHTALEDGRVTGNCHVLLALSLPQSSVNRTFPPFIKGDTLHLALFLGLNQPFANCNNQLPPLFVPALQGRVVSVNLAGQIWQIADFGCHGYFS